MHYRIIFSFILIFIANNVFGYENYNTRNGTITLNASTPLENIDPVNEYVSAVFNANTGDIVFQLKMLSFKFKNALMEEHFNEKYVESEKFPKSIFIGRLFQGDSLLIIQDNEFKVPNDSYKKFKNVIAKGEIQIHGVTKYIEIPGNIIIQKNSISLDATFAVNPYEYNIKIPKIVREKIAKQVIVEVKMTLFPK